MDCFKFNKLVNKSTDREDLCKAINTHCDGDNRCENKVYKCWANKVCEQNDGKNIFGQSKPTAPCYIGSKKERINTRNIRDECRMWNEK
jgi:hypothetical protein